MDFRSPAHRQSRGSVSASRRRCKAETEAEAAASREPNPLPNGRNQIRMPSSEFVSPAKVKVCSVFCFSWVPLSFFAQAKLFVGVEIMGGYRAGRPRSRPMPVSQVCHSVRWMNGSSREKKEAVFRLPLCGIDVKRVRVCPETYATG